MDAMIQAGMAAVENLELAFADQVFSEEHLGLLVGVYSIIMLLRAITPIKERLFTPKWQWLIAPINITLASVGVFLLGLTTFDTFGMQVVMVAFASMFATFTHESVGKYLIDWAVERLKAKIQNNANKS